MEQLGIDAKLLGAQILNFMVIVFVLSKLLYKPILSALEKRRQEIAKGLELSEQMTAEREAMEQARAKVIEKAQKEAATLIEEGKAKAKEAEKVILAEAREEARKIVEKGKTDVDKLHEDLSVKLRSEAVLLAEAMTKRLLTGILTSGDHRKLVETELKKIEKLTA